MSLARWIKIVVSIRLRHSEPITIDSPLLVRDNKGKIVPMTATYMARMDKVYGPVLGWGKATKIRQLFRNFLEILTRKTYEKNI